MRETFYVRSYLLISERKFFDGEGCEAPGKDAQEIEG